MTRRLFCAIGPIIISFESFGNLMLWKILLWKLDPFRVDNFTGNSDLSISLNPSGRKITYGKVFREEQAGFFRHKVYGTCKGALWRYERSSTSKSELSYFVSSEWNRIELLEDYSNTDGHLAFEYLIQMMPGIFLKKDMLTFHGVLLEYSGYGLIISAPSGTGKTTHARLWRDRKRALIINGDRAACRKKDGIWTGFGIPWSGTSGEQINRSVPIKAVVVLERGGENCAFRITEQEAFGAVLPHVQCPAWDAELTGRMLGLLDDFLRNIPVIRLRCLPDGEAVDVLAKAVEDL